MSYCIFLKKNSFLCSRLRIFIQDYFVLTFFHAIKKACYLLCIKVMYEKAVESLVFSFFLPLGKILLFCSVSQETYLLLWQKEQIGSSFENFVTVYFFIFFFHHPSFLQDAFVGCLQQYENQFSSGGKSLLYPLISAMLKIDILKVINF